MKINDILSRFTNPTPNDHNNLLKAIYSRQWNNLSVIYRTPSKVKMNRFDGYIRYLLEQRKLVDYWICDYDANDFCFVGVTESMTEPDKRNFFIYTKRYFVLLLLVPQDEIDLYESKHTRRKLNRRTK